MKTNWQDPGTTEILSSHISGLQEAVGKIEDSIGLQTTAETAIALSEVYITDLDRYRIYQAAEGKRNWVASPAPVIKKNGAVISTDFTIDYGGGAIVLSSPALSTDVFTADFTRTNSTHAITPASIGAESKTDADVHKADYTLQIPYGGTSTNVDNAYSIATPKIDALITGWGVSFEANADSSGAATLNWDGTGAKAIKKANGTDVTNLKNGGIYTLRYNGTNFILQGEGASGNALASDLLSGKTASTDAGDITGTMANLEGDSVALASSVSGTTLKLRPPQGYKDGVDDNVTITDADFIAGNIKNGVDLFGKVGTLIDGTGLKKTASGLSATGASIYATDQDGSAFVTVYPIVVSGLTFKPSRIVMFIEGETSSVGNATAHVLYVEGESFNVYTKPQCPIITWADGYNYKTLQLTGSLYVNTTGFTLPFMMNVSSASVRWTAYE